MLKKTKGSTFLQKSSELWNLLLQEVIDDKNKNRLMKQKSVKGECMQPTYTDSDVL